MREVLNVDLKEASKNMCIDNLVDMYGLIDRTNVRRQLYDMIERCVGTGNISFHDLYEMTGKNLVCAVVNVSEGKLEYHSYSTTPNFKVVDSVLASMSIPGVFTPTLLNGDFYVDGALMDNLPFSVFSPEETFMLSLRTNLPDLTTFKNYLHRVFILGLNGSEEVRIRALPEKLRRHRLLIRLDISSLDFNITKSKKMDVIRQGANATQRFLYPKILISDCMKIIASTLLSLSKEVETMESDDDEKDSVEEFDGSDNDSNGPNAPKSSSKSEVTKKQSSEPLTAKVTEEDD
jgi:hypothetical protein